MVSSGNEWRNSQLFMQIVINLLASGKMALDWRVFELNSTLSLVKLFGENYLKAHAAVRVPIDGIEYVMSVLCCAGCKLSFRK
jgi:hypothetical protein